MLQQETRAMGRRALDCWEFAQVQIDHGKTFGRPKLAALSTDDLLVSALRKGDPQAFEEMVRRFGGRLLAAARRYLRSEADACDALQDAFLCAFRSIGKFKGNSQLSTWLHRIVINSALMYLRANKHRSHESQVDIEQLLPHFDRSANWIDAPASPAPAHIALEVAETRSMVRRCIEQLPEAYKIVLLLRDMDELDTAEVATLLGLTTNTVKVRLHRARQTLKTLIEREQLL